MCNYLCDLFCCCFGKKKRKGRHKSDQKKTTTLYGTNWETLINRVPMSPSQIEDTMISKEVRIEENLDGFDLIATVLKDKYALVDRKLLGSGSYGQVYKVVDKQSGQFCAVKIMKLMGTEDSGGKIPLDIFKREVFAFRRTPHRNIIRLMDHYLIRPNFISLMVLEFANGRDLWARLKDIHNQSKRGFLEKDSKTYFAQISNALNYVHSQGMCHGDLKLDNFLIAVLENGKEIIKVTDFGCARVVMKTETSKIIRNRKAAGTVSYMSPEQLKVFITVNLNLKGIIEKPVSKYNPLKADVWSLGVCLYRMIYFNHPFDIKKETENEIKKSVPQVLKEMKTGIGFKANKTISRELSNDCKDLINSLLQYHKSKRITMNEVMKHNWLQDCPDLDRI